MGRHIWQSHGVSGSCRHIAMTLKRPSRHDPTPQRRHVRDAAAENRATTGRKTGEPPPTNDSVFRTRNRDGVEALFFSKSPRRRGEWHVSTEKSGEQNLRPLRTALTDEQTPKPKKRTNPDSTKKAFLSWMICIPIFYSDQIVVTYYMFGLFPSLFSSFDVVLGFCTVDLFPRRRTVITVSTSSGWVPLDSQATALPELGRRRPGANGSGLERERHGLQPTSDGLKETRRGIGICCNTFRPRLHSQ